MVTREQLTNAMDAATSADTRCDIAHHGMRAALEAVLPAAREQARREALEEAAGVFEEEAADWSADASDAEADGHPRIAADFRRWAKEASKRARRIRALIDQPTDDGWRSMETAPRDGTPILTFIDLIGYAVVAYDADNPKGNEWRVSDLDAWFDTSLIRCWRPIPTPLKET